jgi:uncharacterized membrane protein YdjX (TVP38/TMEM64 family)
MPLRRLMTLVVVAVPAFVAAVLFLPHSPAGLRELLAGLGPAAPAIAMVTWMVLVPAMFPATLLAAAGGLAFGAAAGSALAIGGAVAGGLVAFGLGRFGARGVVEGVVRRRPRLARMHALLERRGFAAMLAARLMPGVPAGGLHYLAGASPVRARSFAAAIALGALLKTVPYALLGQGLGSGSSAGMVVALGSIVLGAVAAIVLVRQLRRNRAPAPAPS